MAECKQRFFQDKIFETQNFGGTADKSLPNIHYSVLDRFMDVGNYDPEQTESMERLNFKLFSC